MVCFCVKYAYVRDHGIVFFCMHSVMIPVLISTDTFELKEGEEGRGYFSKSFILSIAWLHPTWGHPCRVLEINIPIANKQTHKWHLDILYLLIYTYKQAAENFSHFNECFQIWEDIAYSRRRWELATSITRAVWICVQKACSLPLVCAGYFRLNQKYLSLRSVYCLEV